MKPRHKRMIWVLAGVAALGVAAALVLNAFQSNLVFFFTPTQIANGEVPKGKSFRVGDMMWVLDSSGNGADSVTISESTRTLEIGASCTSISSR